MKMYIPFGDWSNDGHGRYEKILVDAPSMNHLLEAQVKIKTIYGKFFFRGMADSYDEPYFEEEIWQALIDTNYPIEQFKEKQDNSYWEECQTLQEVLALEENPVVTLDFVVDAFIWLLNAFGAEITQLDDEEKIPMICNWTCDGFEDVGYGCFY